MTNKDKCKYCFGTGIEPCDNCGDIDDHICHLDGEEYGPSVCRKNCEPIPEDYAHE